MLFKPDAKDATKSAAARKPSLASRLLRRMVSLLPWRARQLVVAGCDAPEVLQSVEGTLDTPAKLVEAL
jgi:hypothetical protein